MTPAFLIIMRLGTLMLYRERARQDSKHHFAHEVGGGQDEHHEKFARRFIGGCTQTPTRAKVAVKILHKQKK